MKIATKTVTVTTGNSGNTYQNEKSLLMYWFAKANSELKY